MVEAEAAFYRLDDVMGLAEGLVRYVVGRVLERQEAQLRLLERDTGPLTEVLAGPFPAPQLHRGPGALAGGG